MFYFDADKKYPKVTESRVKVRFQDCDPLQHLNNAKYFDYIIALVLLVCVLYYFYKLLSKKMISLIPILRV